MRARIGVICNPNAGKNRRFGLRRQELEAAVGNAGLVIETPSLAALRPAMATLIAEGCDYWVCDGGDGSLHWMLSEGYTQLARLHGPDGVEPHLPIIVPANGGSIDFVARKAGTRGRPTGILARLAHKLRAGRTPATVTLDTLRVDGVVAAGAALEPAPRLGFAAAVGGAPQRFFAKLYEHPEVNGQAIVDTLTRASAGIALGYLPGLGLAQGQRATPWLERWLPARERLAALRQYGADLLEPLVADVEVDGHRYEFPHLAAVQVGAIDINLAGVIRTFGKAATPGVIHVQALCTDGLGLLRNVPLVMLGLPMVGARLIDAAAQQVTLRVRESGAAITPVVDGEQLPPFTTLRIARGPALRVASVRA